MANPVPPGVAHPHTGVPILLAGGPCGGTLRYVTPRVARTGRVRCQGAIYVPDPRDTNWPPKEPYTTERWIPNWQAATILSGHIPKQAKNVAHAWSRLMRAFAHTGIAQIDKTRRATARLDRLAYKYRRHR